MKKRVFVFALVLTLLVGAVVPTAHARATMGELSLTFNGTTATCDFYIMKAGSDIKVTMTLWQGNRQIASWTEQSKGVVWLVEQCPVSKGLTYTLTVNFTIDGTSMPEQSVTKTN